MEKVLESPDFKKAIADFVFTSRYARYNEKLGRRETWEEAVNRVLQMHLKKFKHLPEEQLEEIKWAFSLVKDKKVAPSMRALADDTPIPTPDGWKTVGEMEEGDTIFDKNGIQTKIKKIKRFKNKPLNDVIFSDGSILRACNEHLW